MGTTTVNWANYTEKVARKNSARLEKFYEMTCGGCGSTYELRKYDANKAVAENRVCKKCQLAARQAKGYAVCAQKYGDDFVVQLVIKQQLSNPSKPEQQIAAWLDQLGVGYQRQVVIDLGVTRYIVDFLLSDGKAIEGAGGYWHARNKQQKDAMLAESMIVLFLNDDLVMNNPAEAFALITRYVNA